ncbi:unnamed protein product [Echinostoma caproni]|uniref:GMC_oxred_C domain-containing protein n=1 Tax=Echinostoma caproni TaxID=27848 RepID=A0A183BA74_9TREM|nr:unnamed protein product [Echinostoma caproni]
MGVASNTAYGSFGICDPLNLAPFPERYLLEGMLDGRKTNKNISSPHCWAAPQTADVRLPIPDPIGLGSTPAMDNLAPAMVVVSTVQTTCVRILDQVEERTPCLIYKVF